MYVFSNVTFSPTGMTGSSSPIALALFPPGVSRGRRTCRDEAVRERSAEPRSARDTRGGVLGDARRSAGTEVESTDA